AAAPVATTPPPPQPAVWTGRVRFEARDPTPTGASQARRVLPARFVRVRAEAPDGTPIAEARTDAEGAFRLEATEAATMLAIESTLEHEGIELAVTTDGAGTEPHVFRAPLGTPQAPIDLVVRDEHAEAGALHILDTMLLGAQAVQAWTGETLPPFFAYWGRGVTTVWSFYTGERPAGSGRYTIELLGGEPGQQHTTDTDEHDEMIVLHEFGHFVMDRLSSDSSHGGQHPRGFQIDPGLAWEEGRATWFATMVLASPLYQDTIGIQPTGQLRVNHDLERGDERDVRGIGSESSVAEVLWDLADGAGEIEDADEDGVALGPATLLEAMIELGRRPGAHPALPTFLRHLVQSGRVEATAVKRLLALGGHPAELLPEDDTSRWPLDLAVPGKVADKIDGVSDPAPSGGPPRPSNGADAVKVYRVHLEEPARLVAMLEIFGSGRGQDREDLDLELRDIRSELLDRSAGQGRFETISRRLEPGWYLLTVRDGGRGNRVGYELRVELR
ncbi:MAG: hypothetical protein CMH59_25755, partial [Myxococcales bacterium]|nr:hypothetical protein [Myxococcales bacterium]